MLPGGVDTEQKYVVPDGCVNLPGPEFFHAYEVFIQWCRRNSIDLFVFGWDWRRSVQDAADFFLNVFLPMFDARFSGKTPHPLDYFAFLGHSAGGMVVKAMLNSTANQYVQRVKKAITVATPFYGYGEQIRRFLKGDPNLLWAGFPRSVSATIVSSLPGGYEYLYLDYPTYLANQAAFASDPEGYHLSAYPSMDQDKATEVADPYDRRLSASGPDLNPCCNSCWAKPPNEEFSGTSVINVRDSRSTLGSRTIGEMRMKSLVALISAVMLTRAPQTGLDNSLEAWVLDRMPDWLTALTTKF